MAEIGKFNTLRVVKHVDFGVYLDGEELGEILLPNRDVPAHCHTGDMIEVVCHGWSGCIPQGGVGECCGGFP
jgi:predicted RNA-binding protein (virulence factor B family)